LGLVKKIGDGKQQALDIIRDYKYFSISTDDNIMFAPLPVSFEELMDDVFCFSMRLGFNTVVQNHFADTFQPGITSKPFEHERHTIKWNFRDHNPHDNYGYPMSLDFHFFHTKVMMGMMKSIDFDKPSNLEAGLVPFAQSVPNPYMRSFKHSVVVNVPITNMTGATQSTGVSLVDLNTTFLEGKTLRFDEEQIVGCHQNLNWNLVG
jgi:hypothetical protein